MINHLLQVLCGILPISRISAVPACIHFVTNLLPLERILNLGHPNELIVPTEDKRTWREGMTPAAGTSRIRAWTAMDILIAYANSKGWVTAKAARPDIHRAGNSGGSSHALNLFAPILIQRRQPCGFSPRAKSVGRSGPQMQIRN